MVNAATYVGASQAGIPGAIAATLGVILPSSAILLMLVALSVRYPAVWKKDMSPIALIAVSAVLGAGTRKARGRYDCVCLMYTKGHAIGYPCPFAKKMKELMQTDLGDKVKILDYTH